MTGTFASDGLPYTSRRIAMKCTLALDRQSRGHALQLGGGRVADTSAQQVDFLQMFALEKL